MPYQHELSNFGIFTVRYISFSGIDICYLQYLIVQNITYAFLYVHKSTALLQRNHNILVATVDVVCNFSYVWYGLPNLLADSRSPSTQPGTNMALGQ